MISRRQNPSYQYVPIVARIKRVICSLIEKIFAGAYNGYLFCFRKCNIFGSHPLGLCYLMLKY